MSGTVKTQEVILHHAPPSFYSQIARLVLAEKGVLYQGRIAMAGPPLFETYQPWYMRLNPAGTVPTLVIGDEVLDDSRVILHEVDARFEGKPLTPSSPDAIREMERWIGEAYGLSERILTYGSARFRNMGARVNARRRKRLLRLRDRHPGLRAQYDAKLADIDAFMADAGNSAAVAALDARYDASLDALDAWLSDRRYICGASYSLADVVWTVLVARQLMLGRSALAARPSLAAWYGRVRERNAFREADVWERFNAWKLLPVMLSKLKWHLLALVVVGGIVAFICA